MIDRNTETIEQKVRETMKITLDFSDNVRCAFVNYVRENENGLEMTNYILASEDLHEGNVIKIPKGAESGVNNG